MVLPPSDRFKVSLAPCAYDDTAGALIEAARAQYAPLLLSIDCLGLQWRDDPPLGEISSRSRRPLVLARTQAGMWPVPWSTLCLMA